ncbi:hypothetical protein PUN28_002653 [Cardiocondyla obscurior]|uniref:Uncharacterized protein n=1 Tax=Cardiocondyla obscurior TaxID=286306 RepID=A0AAW2GVN9_9HYME
MHTKMQTPIQTTLIFILHACHIHLIHVQEFNFKNKIEINVTDFHQFKAAGRDCRCPVGFPACTVRLLLRPVSAIWTSSIEGSKDRSRKLYAIIGDASVAGLPGKTNRINLNLPWIIKICLMPVEV